MDPFKIGDTVIYPNQGLGVIEDIKTEKYFGQMFQVYHLRLLSNNTLVFVPSSNTKEIGIRKPISQETVKKIFHLLKTGSVEVTTNWKGRYKEHTSLMKSGTIVDIVSVLKSLYYLSLMKTLSFREKKMMEKAMELIVSEIAEVSSMPEYDIQQKVLNTLSAWSKSINPGMDL